MVLLADKRAEIRTIYLSDTIYILSNSLTFSARLYKLLSKQNKRHSTTKIRKQRDMIFKDRET